ncbi:hypothetical protein EZ428_02710 [Pedobacter frigiditerrae]|uniref:Uncharacterized protein n=1 Tax=Pedobacter frigiditerrae TaxID=2530452 RepID=A0A4R0N1M2_9SPHI|nr:hypothetical protein [Pedobacter frigiditerrae]TCC93699.1 hypothetical protein EZ428_02710 [Pedobacter frigiditerrae]
MNVLLDGDITQTKLIEFCAETEALLSSALKKVDKFSDCKIHTSLDLGFPHDLIRIAGGFPTGSFVEWKSTVPFIPVDTTVNICTGSIFEITGDINYFNKFSFDNLLKSLTTSSYIFNFNRGNHFIIIAQSSLTKKYYLLLHSSASEFKKQFNGLYPIKGNWFYNDIKTVSNGSRYLRYIDGHKAELFAKVAEGIKQYNCIRHEFIAETLLGANAIVNKVDHYHHYYMPDSSSVMLGSYLAKENDTYPIFTSPGNPIFIYQVHKHALNEISFRNEEYYLVPHGWGKMSKNIDTMKIDLTNNTFTLNNTELQIQDDASLRDHDDLSLRNFSVDPMSEDFYFKLIGAKIKGIVVDRLEQKISYTKHGFKNWQILNP